MGAYHSCIEVDGFRYTFAAQVGVIKSSSPRQGVPEGAAYEKAVPLGACNVNRGEINSILQKLQSKFFHPRAYHLLVRNCNNFAETFATALILRDDLIEGKRDFLQTFPQYVNRLASVGKSFVGSGGDDIVPCNVVEEAAVAVGALDKVGWNFDAGDSKSHSMSSSKGRAAKGKKELSEKQKAALAKIKGSKA